MDSRLRAVCDLSIPGVREGAGRHEYDGLIQDLSPAGVRGGLDRLGGPPLSDPHDEAHLSAFENGLRVALGDLELHRRDPLIHAGNLDLAGYDRAYAPESERADARRRHLAAWPDAVDMAVESLDQVSAPVAEALLPAIKGLSADVDEAAGDVERAALAAHARLVDLVERASHDGDPDPALGEQALARLMGTEEALDVDLGKLSVIADAERDRLTNVLHEACARIEADRSPAELIPELLADHPDIEGVIAEAQAQVEEVLEFTREKQLAPHTDGECIVGPAPKSRSWAMAMMAWAAPGETEAPSWYYITPPDPSWPAAEIEEWLAVFSRTTLPAITAHEVSPGHFAHGRSLRRAAGPVRQVLHPMSFAEGWAHYVEEVFIEEGFRGGDPRFAVGVCLEALVRVTRLSCAIGLHTRSMTVDEATTRFEQDAFLGRAAARSEARRGTFDATYGRYTWGKLAIFDLRERARAAWGPRFSLPAFHVAMLRLGSPPLGLLDAALEIGPEVEATVEDRGGSAIA